MDDNKVSVVIGDEIITVKATEDVAYLQRLARYVDDKINEVVPKSTAAKINEKIKTLLIALNIADDYLKTLDICKQIDEVHTKYVLESGKSKEENVKLKKEINELKKELAAKNAELEELINNFDDDSNIIPMPQKSRKGLARNG